MQRSIDTFHRMSTDTVTLPAVLLIHLLFLSSPLSSCLQ